MSLIYYIIIINESLKTKYLNRKLFSLISRFLNWSSSFIYLGRWNLDLRKMFIWLKYFDVNYMQISVFVTILRPGQGQFWALPFWGQNFWKFSAVKQWNAFLPYIFGFIKKKKFSKVFIQVGAQQCTYSLTSLMVHWHTGFFIARKP